MAYHPLNGLVDYLESVENKENFTTTLKNQILNLKLELKFLSTFLRCSPIGLLLMKDRDDQYILDLLTRIAGFVEDAEMKLSLISAKDLNDEVPNMLEKIKVIQSEILGVVLLKQSESTLLESSELLDSETALKIIDSLLGNLKDLVNGKTNSIFTLKERIEAVQESIGFLGSILQFTANSCCIDDDEYVILKDLLAHVGAVAPKAAQLSYLCWVDELKEEMVSHISVLLFDLLQKIKPTTNQEVREIYFRVLKASKSQPINVAMKEEFIVAFIDSLLQNLMELENSEDQANLMVPSEVQIQTLPENLRFIKALLIDLPNQYIEYQKLDNLLINIEAIVREAGFVVYRNFAIVHKEDEAKEMNLALLSVLEQTGLIKAEIRRIYLETSKYNLPRTSDIVFVDPILRNLKDLLNNPSKSINIAKQEIESLQVGLAFLSSFFKEQKKQKDLCSRCVEAAYQADYVVNSFVSRGGLVWHHLVCTVLEEIDLIKAELIQNHIQQAFETESLSFAKKSIDEPRNIRLTPTPLKNKVAVGLGYEAKVIINHLTRGSSQFRAVSIVGMPGIGKTTLARKIYMHSHVTDHFHRLAWCSVSQQYEKRKLLLAILGQITAPSSNIYDWPNEHLEEHLRKHLLGLRYFIVMDDIWDVNAWTDIKYSLPNNANGSRVLFTSRICDVALEADPDSYVHPLRLLSDEECFELLELKLFHKNHFPLHLKDIGMQIARSCRGLPLAVVTIAGILESVGFEQDMWKQVTENIISPLKNGSERAMKILELSYDHLPYHLKLCFLYFGGIPEDSEIPVQNLMWLWIAEGFIEKTDQSKSLEDVAEDYLMELIARSLVIVTKSSSGRVKKCRIHDLLGEFCKMKATEANCLQQLSRYDELAFLPNSNMQQRLFIYSKRQHFSEWKPQNPRLVSLLFFPTDDMHLTKPYDISFIYLSFKLLRVLNLVSINMGNSFPIGIELLVHLRYLAVQGQFKHIPSTIDKLRSLETFIMKGLRGEILLPNTIWNMMSLRHLHVNSRVAFDLQEYKAEISKLEHLSTFSTPALSYGKDIDNIMRRLPNIRKLRCIFLESWDTFRNCNLFPALDFVSVLEALKVTYHGVQRYPCELKFPQNLKELTLSKFRLPWNEISAIGRLPNLEVLKLLTQSFDGQQWDMREGEFLNLKFLKLAELNIVNWNAYEDHLPNLRHLILKSCKNLVEIPATLGDICTLEKIELQYCGRSAVISAMQLQEEIIDLKVLIYPRNSEY